MDNDNTNEPYTRDDLVNDLAQLDHQAKELPNKIRQMIEKFKDEDKRGN